MCLDGSSTSNCVLVYFTCLYYELYFVIYFYLFIIIKEKQKPVPPIPFVEPSERERERDPKSTRILVGMAASPLAPLSGCARPATTILSRISTAIFFSPSGRTSSSSAVLHRLPFSTSPSPRSLSPRTRGLRLPGPPGSDDELDSSDSNASPKKSRNEKKREARRAVRWGMELSAFPVPQIKRVLKLFPFFSFEWF